MAYHIHDASVGTTTRLELVVDDHHMATLTQVGEQPPQLTWAVYGPQYWPAAKELLLGLLELSVHADRLTRGASHGDKKSGR